jgi:RNA polymerase sigma factor (sigma-70 family)
MIDDAELLRRYAEEGSADAFAELVQRNIDIVYAAALRRVGDRHRAEDVAQSVFIDLARKARRLCRHPSLVSWLYTSTRFAALKTIRAEQRRLAREQEVHIMHDILRDETAAEWERLRPILDEAMHDIGERDREIVLLRYFRGLPFVDVARLLVVSEGTARMRLDRALDKLNAQLVRRGITSTATALGTVLALQSGAAAPAGLAASATTAAFASSGASGVLATTFVIMSKTKFAVASALVVAALSTAVVEIRANRALQEQLSSQGPDDSGVLQRENEQRRAEVARLGAQNPEFAELDRLQARRAVLQARPSGVVDAELRPPRNMGRATPAAAVETFCWALDQGDLDLVASFVTLRDDTPENRAEFMVRFSPTVRDRYRTAERLCAAAFFGQGLTRPHSQSAMQVVSVTEDHGPDQAKIKLWFRASDGREAAGGDTFVRRVDGWAGKPLSLLGPEITRLVGERIDPRTGDYIAQKSAPAKATR